MKTHSFITKLRANAANKSLVLVAGAGALLASQQAAKADAISEAVGEFAGIATSIGTGAAGLVAIWLVWVGFKVARRLMSKV